MKMFSLPAASPTQARATRSNLRWVGDSSTREAPAAVIYENELTAAILDYRFGPEEVPRLRQLRARLEMDPADVQSVHTRALRTLAFVIKNGPWARDHREFVNLCLQNLE